MVYDQYTTAKGFIQSLLVGCIPHPLRHYCFNYSFAGHNGKQIHHGLHPKWKPIHYIVHNFLPEPYRPNVGNSVNWEAAMGFFKDQDIKTIYVSQDQAEPDLMGFCTIHITH